MNLLHDIPLTTDNFENINCIVEVPKDTGTKYQYDDKLEIFELKSQVRPKDLIMGLMRLDSTLDPHLILPHGP